MAKNETPRERMARLRGRDVNATSGASYTPPPGAQTAVPPAGGGSDAERDARVEFAMQNIDDLSAHGDSNRAREQWKIWDKSFDSNCPPNTPYQAEDGTGCVEKPDNSNNPNAGGRQNLPGGVAGNPRGGGGGGGGGKGGGPGGGGTYGGAPAFNYDDWKPPSYEDATSEPGYQFALNEGFKGINSNAAARGTLRTSGTLKNLYDYGNEAGAQQYQNVFDRSAQAYGINRDTARDKFAPQYGSWGTTFGANENRWQTKYGGNLDKYMQRENNIYGLLNQPMPTYPGY